MAQDKKIEDLRKMIAKTEEQARAVEEKIIIARERADKGEITKAKFQSEKIRLTKELKGHRAKQIRLKKQMLNRERMLKDKSKEAEEKEKKKRKREQEHQRLKEKRRKKKLRNMEREEEEKPRTEKKPKKKSFLAKLLGR